jgi:Tol biopolymer transport system component
VSEQTILELMQKGIAAAKAGNKKTARDLFEEVIALDKNHEKAWFWLASVVDTDEQRRVCLGNVLFLNPENERAKRLLDRLEAEAAEGKGKKKGKEGFGRQIDRRLLIGGGGGAVVLVLLLVLLSGGGGQPPGPQTTNTPTPTNTAVTSTATRTLIPTWTPSPEPTLNITDTPPPLPSPAGLSGRLAFGSGSHFFAERFLPVIYTNADGSNPVTVGDENTRTRGRYPVFPSDGQNLIYELGFSDGSSRLTMVDLFGENRVQITDGAVQDVIGEDGTITQQEIRFGAENHPAWSPNRSQVAFAGALPARITHQIYVVTMGGATPLITQVTDNEFDNTWPSWSPDGQRLIYVSDRRAQGGVDLRIGAIDGSSDVNLTFNGNDLIERAPDWSPDTRRVVFEGTAVENYEAGEYDAYDSDIYIIDDVSAEEPPRLLFPPAEKNDDTENARDMLPRFSPDGGHVAFTSNRSGKWEIYVLEIDTGELYQVTFSDREINIIGDWGVG